MCVKCFASQEDGRVMLAVMAMNGYHSTASYQWLHNKTLLKHNKTPLLYTSRTGTITCVVTAREDQKEVHFCVTGKKCLFLTTLHVLTHKGSEADISVIRISSQVTSDRQVTPGSFPPLLFSIIAERVF